MHNSPQTVIQLPLLLKTTNIVEKLEHARNDVYSIKILQITKKLNVSKGSEGRINKTNIN